MGAHRAFQTTERGLHRDNLPFRLYQKAKKFGTWDPDDIDFSQDALDFAALTQAQQSGTLRLLSQFQAGEEAVTVDLLPLIMTVSRLGCLEEEMFLSAFLFEEAKHTEFFSLVFAALNVTGDLAQYHSPTYLRIFEDILPTALNRLILDDSPEAVADAATVYNMFVEGVLAETGYWSLYQGLHQLGQMPGLIKGITYLKTDESRHIAYGTFLLQRLICEHPHLYQQVTKRLYELLPLSMELNREGMNAREESPFTFSLEQIVQFSMKQFQTRMDVLKRAIGKTVDEIYQTPESALGVE